MNSKRSISVDITKGVAIMAIVLGHVSYLYSSNSLVDSEVFIYSLWHVSVFFILAGFFIKDDHLFNQNFGLRKSSHRFI